MNAADKLSKILEALGAGRTVYISTALKHIKVTKKNVAQFEAIGRPLFKVAGQSLYISAGKRYDCIDFCKITATGGAA